jgi:hypothetical protein
MNTIGWRYAGAVAATAIAVAAATSGITYAATRATPQVVYGCINSHSVLKLLANGHCANGYAKVGINRSGVRGPRGLKGPTGAAGPGVRTAYVTSMTDTGKNTTISIASIHLNVYLVCNVGAFSQSSVYLIDNGGASAYRVTGWADVTLGGGFADVTPAGNDDSLSGGLTALDFTQPGDEPSAVEFRAYTNSGASPRMRADLTIRRDGHTWIVRFYVDQNPTKCRSWAAVIPAD